ncbi:MAG: cation:proton antiporter [Euryarchaeota archaeon]|nr:cation:proton antiporter [Euryarchaeota archaeon]
MAAAAEEVFLQLTILLSVAVASHFIIKRFNQPTIIGEIGIGVVLGPSILGYIVHGGPPPSVGPTLFDPVLITIFANLGAIFLLFLIGLETDVRAIYQKRNIAVAIGGVVLPWAFGFLTAFFMVPNDSLMVGTAETPRFVMATFVGATLVATSTAIAAAVLLELGMIRTEVAGTIMGAVIVDDILGLLVLSISLGVAGGAVDILSILYLLGVSIAFIVLAMYIGTRYFGRLVTWTQARGLKVGLTHAGFMVAMAVAFFAAFMSEAIGLSAVIGAFLAGAMFSNTPLREDFHEGVAFLGAVFTPVFFISLGLLVNVWTITSDLLLFGIVLLAVAFVTKLIGCGLPARWAGMSKAESLAVGYGMVPRGEVGLIIALVAQQAGVIGPDLFSIIVLVMVIVSVLPAPLLRKYLMMIPKPAPEGAEVSVAPDPKA